jgi:hypothetical protein
MEFRVDQVDLTEVGLTRVTRDSRAMLDRLAQMRITLHSSPGEEPDASLIRLGKGVRWCNNQLSIALSLNSPKSFDLSDAIYCLRSFNGIMTTRNVERAMERLARAMESYQ